MKKNIITFLVFILAPIGVFAQCAEFSIEKTGKIIAERNFEIKNQISQSETILTVEAETKNSSWSIKDAESAVLTIFVDGKYSQDLMLFLGAEKFTYPALLGKFAPGTHKVTLILNEARSAKNARQVKIHRINIDQANLESSENLFALNNAPILYARPDTIDKFSDIPLISYYEIFDEAENIKKIRYTTVFTNEDGGTQSAALMARWGRMTDIEWVYEIRIDQSGKILSEIYQGANHETKTFNGRRISGSHPLIFDATVNNNFSDAGCSKLRFALVPVRKNLSGSSRETVMDEFSWTYRIMAQEAVREGRVNAAMLDANTIDDPRAYLYAEVYSELTDSVFALETQAPDGKIISSDSGNKYLRINRNGYVRIAMRMTQNKNLAFPASVSINCYSKSDNISLNKGICQNVCVIKLMRLDQNYLPVFQNLNSFPRNIKVGERAVFSYGQRKKQN